MTENNNPVLSILNIFFKKYRKSDINLQSFNEAEKCLSREIFVCPDCNQSYMKCDHCGKEVPIEDIVDMFHVGICEHCQHTDSAGNIHEHQLCEECPDHLPDDKN